MKIVRPPEIPITKPKLTNGITVTKKLKRMIDDAYIFNILLNVIENMGIDIPIMHNTHIENDLGLDSLDLIELITTIEDRFRIVIEDEEAIKLKTIDNIIKHIRAKL